MMGVRRHPLFNEEDFTIPRYSLQRVASGFFSSNWSPTQSCTPYDGT